MNAATAVQPAGFTKVRPLTGLDRIQWSQLYRQYAEFYQAPMSDAILDRTWSWLMTPEHPEEGIVAELQGGELVGLGHFRAFPEPLLGQDAGFLDDLFVVPNQRGKGIGRSLIAAVAITACKRGWPFVRWMTARDNEQARHLYDDMSQLTQWVTYDLTPTGGPNS